jgi:mannose-6-phosphate isomerase-like protein (cupin superfamily)
MQIIRRAQQPEQGWYVGPWNSKLTISIGYADHGVDEPHFHQTMSEIYLIGSGTAEIRVEGNTILLAAGDVIVVEPGEAHTFLSSSPDFSHFVIQTPGLIGEAALTDKTVVARERLGL